MNRESRIEKSDRARNRRKTIREIRKKLLKRLHAHNKHLKEKTKKNYKTSDSLITVLVLEDNSRNKKKTFEKTACS